MNINSWESKTRIKKKHSWNKWHSGWLVCTSAPQFWPRGFKSGLWCSFVGLASNPRACVGFLRVLLFPSTSPKKNPHMVDELNTQIGSSTPATPVKLVDLFIYLLLYLSWLGADNSSILGNWPGIEPRLSSWKGAACTSVLYWYVTYILCNTVKSILWEIGWGGIFVTGEKPQRFGENIIKDKEKHK